MKAYDNNGDRFKESQLPSAFPRPTADQLAALPAGITERGFDPYSKKLLGGTHFMRSMLPEHAYAAFEAYQRAAWAFDDARLTFLVALHSKEEK